MIRPVLLATLLPLAAVTCGPRYDYPDGRGIEGQLEREVVALQMTVRELQAEASNCGQLSGPADPVYNTLHQVLNGTEVAVEAKGPVTVVRYPGNHLFSYDSLSVREEASMTLDMVATALKQNPEYTVLLEGHTADLPPNAEVAARYPDQWTLSYARAVAVMAELVDRFGVEESRFTLAGRGAYDPIATNDTPAGQAQNRRVVIFIYPPGVQ